MVVYFDDDETSAAGVGTGEVVTGALVVRDVEAGDSSADQADGTSKECENRLHGCLERCSTRWITGVDVHLMSSNGTSYTSPSPWKSPTTVIPTAIFSGEGDTSFKFSFNMGHNHVNPQSLVYCSFRIVAG